MSFDNEIILSVVGVCVLKSHISEQKINMLQTLQKQRLPTAFKNKQQAIDIVMLFIDRVNNKIFIMMINLPVWDLLMTRTQS